MTAPSFNPALLGLTCPSCDWQGAPSASHPVCPSCGKPLVTRYDLARIARDAARERLEGWDLWRYAAVLPFVLDEHTVRLGEGGTPLLSLDDLARDLSLARLWLKDEAPNPTQSFKARGLVMAINGALALDREAIALPSAGNAGSAAAAYAAAAGLPCRVAIPVDTPEPFVLETRGCGAEVKLVDGTIADAGKSLGAWAPPGEWWNVATFKEPFRVEGKKTLGYEIAEQTDWHLPDAILYPTGGGTGLVGMWRAFLEMREMGWIDDPLPRLIAVQVAGCAPVVRALDSGAERVTAWEGAETVASGLRVPAPFADELVLRSIRETNGLAVAVEEDEMLDAMRLLAEEAGCYACPEGGATLAALSKLYASGSIREGERVVIFNTGSGLKYPKAWRLALARAGKAVRT